MSKFKDGQIHFYKFSSVKVNENNVVKIYKSE